LQQFEVEENKLKLHDAIGDLGSVLTNGQKKILSYCRAFLTDKSWLIIDQPYRDLNENTIELLKSMINSLKEKKTIIIFDTNIPDGLKADDIYVIKNNKLTKRS